MRKKVLCYRAAAALSLLLLFGVGGVACGGGQQMGTLSDPTGYGPAVLYINNLSNEPLYGIFFSPSNTSSWGTDYLGGQPLYIGETFQIYDISPGDWDILVVDSSGNRKEFYQLGFGAGGTYSLDVGSSGWTAP